MALVSKVRTELELKNPDLNYFIAFKIDLKEKDVDKIREAVKRKRNTFAASQTVINSRLNDLTVDIDEVLFNDAIFDATSGTYNRNAGGRKLEAERAKAFKIEHAVETANVLCGRGYITEAEVQQIAQKNECTDKDILDKISGLFSQGIEFKKKMLIKREIPFNKFDDSETWLGTVQKKNLYDFLGVSETAVASQIEAERSKIYAIAQKQGKNTQATATINLCGLIKTVFKNPQARQEYDVYYKCKNEIWDPLRLFKDSGTKTINERMLTDMSNAMRMKTGLSLDQVGKELEAYLSYFNLVSEGTQDGKKLQLEQCPYSDCGKSYIAKAGVKVCPHCNRSLEIICWNCGQKTLYSSSCTGCTNCGVTNKQQADFTQAFQNFECISKRLDVTEIQLNSAFNALENVFADYKRFNASFIYKKIQEAI